MPVPQDYEPVAAPTDLIAGSDADLIKMGERARYYFEERVLLVQQGLTAAECRTVVEEMFLPPHDTLAALAAAASGSERTVTLAEVGA